MEEGEIVWKSPPPLFSAARQIGGGPVEESDVVVYQVRSSSTGACVCTCVERHRAGIMSSRRMVPLSFLLPPTAPVRANWSRTVNPPSDLVVKGFPPLPCTVHSPYVTRSRFLAFREPSREER